MIVVPRDIHAARHFINDLASRLTYKVQLTTDGHNAYLNAIEDAFGRDIDFTFAQLVKLYGGVPEHPDVKYSPERCIGTKRAIISGRPNTKHISTSFAERQNLTMRMSMRRFTRLTNAFSKKLENHEAAVALHFMYYNFCRIHQALRVTPAIEAKITDYVWDIEEIVRLLA